MKKVILALSLLLSVATIPTFSQPHSDDPVVIIVKTGENNGDGPRSLGIAPIQGVVSGGVIYLGFAGDFGEVEVSVDELINGPILNTMVDSSDLFAIIPFTTNPGDYHITFTLSSGQEYVGEFSVL